MTIDPRWGFYISIALAVFGVLATSTTQLTTIFGEHTTNIIIAISMMIMTVGNALNAILHGLPSAVPKDPAMAHEFPLGPAAKP